MEKNQDLLITMKIIWGALLASIFVYMYVCFLQTGAPALEVSYDFSNPLVLSLSLGSLVALVMSSVLPKLMLKSTKQRFKTKDPSRQEKLQAYFAPFVIQLALIESVALFGLVISFSTNENKMLPFAALAIIGFLFHYPSERKLHSAFASE